jgi:DNA-binding LacI/PurR family transcriptional regulator
VIVSVGQSADAAIVKLALNTQYQLGLEYKPQAGVADLSGKKTLVAVVGSTPEGLAAAGTDLPAELSRAKTLLATARESGIGVLLVHTGGQSRRDKASTQLIEATVPLADYVVVVAGGNNDKLFHKLAAPRGTPVVQVDRVPRVGGAVGAVYKRPS